KHWLHCKCLESLLKESNEMHELRMQIGKDMELLLDKDLIKLLCIPTFQGRHYGVVGYRMLTLAIWKSFREACKAEKKALGLDLQDHITQDVMVQVKRSYMYHCPI
ncbi:hypothetical protein V8E55_011950, partial [Tylopilus felleus]